MSLCVCVCVFGGGRHFFLLSLSGYLSIIQTPTAVICLPPCRKAEGWWAGLVSITTKDPLLGKEKVLGGTVGFCPGPWSEWAGGEASGGSRGRNGWDGIWTWESGAAGTAQVLQNGRWASWCLRRIGRRGQPRMTHAGESPLPSQPSPQPHCLSPWASSDLILEKSLLKLPFLGPHQHQEVESC